MSAYENRKQRWREFMAGSRPGQKIFLIAVKNDDIRPPCYPEYKAERIEFAWMKYNQLCQAARWCDDDTIPYLDIYSGTEIFAEAFGCEVKRLRGENPFAMPMIHSASEVSRLKVPNLDCPPIAVLFEIADALYQRAERTAVLKVPDIQSPIGIASLIWDKADFYMAMIEAPEAVRELADKTSQFLTTFLDEWFSRYGIDFVAPFPDYYMPAGIALAEDEVGAVDTEVFKNLFFPHLARLSERYGGIGIHCCANSQHQWNNFKTIPNLRLLNLIQAAGVISMAYDFFGDSVCHWHCGWEEPWDQHARTNADKRIVFNIVVDSKQQAISLAERIRMEYRDRQFSKTL
jgi:hypothetical protein